MHPRVRAQSRPRFHGGCGGVCFVENVEVCAHGRLHSVREHGISLSQMHGESGGRWEWVSVHLRGPLRCADLCGVRRGLETAPAAATGMALWEEPPLQAQTRVYTRNTRSQYHREDILTSLADGDVREATQYLDPRQMARGLFFTKPCS